MNLQYNTYNIQYLYVYIFILYIWYTLCVDYIYIYSIARTNPQKPATGSTTGQMVPPTQDNGAEALEKLDEKGLKTPSVFASDW